MSRSLKSLLVVFFAVLAVVLFGTYEPAKVVAGPATERLLTQDVCEDGGNWVKVDGLSSLSFTYNAPTGYVITAWCYKASTTLVSGAVNPPATSVTVTSTVTNRNGQFQNLSHASFLLEKEEYEVCSETDAEYGQWSEWTVDPNDLSREVRSRSITYVDSEDGETVCGRDVEYDYRPRQTCLETYAVYGDWSEWTVDPNDPTQEIRTRSVTYLDAIDNQTVCGSDVQKEFRDIPVNSCLATNPVYGDWSEWVVDPGNPAQEMRTRVVTYVDAVDGETYCGEATETEYRSLGKVPYCTVEGETVWLPVGVTPPDGATDGECVKEPWVKKTPPTCPTCGPRVEEVGGPDDLIISWYSQGDCIVNLKTWCIEITETFVYLRAEHPFSVLVSQGSKAIDEYNDKLAEANKTASFPTPLVAYHTQLSASSLLTYLDASPFVGVDGKTYYILDVPRELTGGYLVLYDEDGNRWREVYGKVLSWVSCSRTVGPWDIPADGIVRKDLFGGPVDWDWEKFLVDEGYVDSWPEAHEWLLDFYAVGEKALPAK